MKKLLVLVAVILLATSFTQKKITWVAIGDSITYLNEHPDETGNRVTKGYMTRVVEALPNISYSNQGHNGWTSGGIADKIDELGIEKADLYSIFLGTNDWWAGRPVGTIADYQNNKGNETIYGSFRIIIDKIKQLNKDARIILITPMQRTDFVYLTNFKNNAWGSYKEKNGQSLKQVVDAIRAIAVYEHIDVVDLYNAKGMDVKHLVKFKRLKNPATGSYQNYGYPAYTAITFNPDTDEYPYPAESIDITYDGLHPSDKGNEMIAKMLVKIMKKF